MMMKMMIIVIMMMMIVIMMMMVRMIMMINRSFFNSYTRICHEVISDITSDKEVSSLGYFCKQMF